MVDVPDDAEVDQPRRLGAQEEVLQAQAVPSPRVEPMATPEMALRLFQRMRPGRASLAQPIRHPGEDLLDRRRSGVRADGPVQVRLEPVRGLDVALVQQDGIRGRGEQGVHGIADADHDPPAAVEAQEVQGVDEVAVPGHQQVGPDVGETPA